MSEANRARPGRILVVDDEPKNRKLLEGYLRAEGYEVRGAEDGPTALEMAHARVPDVVLLDVMMPVMTGYEVCRSLKSDPRTRLSQVMLVTALDSTPDQIQGLDTGADDYIPKPVRREEFLAKVRALLRVHDLMRELEAARAALEQRNQELTLKKTLAQTLVHDLKSPLSAILGNLDLLEMRVDERLRYLVLRSKSGAKRMLKMIMNLLDIEGLEEGKLEPGLETIDATQLIRAAVQESDATAEQRGVRFQLETEEGCWVQADAVLIRRVLDNLISNALSHSPTGSVVTIGARSRDEGIELFVSDEGPGVPEEHREHVFDKYGQLALRRSGMSVNRGLGLTFCLLAVEAHGGTIWIETAPGGGACFRTLLPEAASVATAATLGVAAES